MFEWLLEPLLGKKVTVTEEDIKLGLRGSPIGCPVARACKRAWPDYRISVGATRIIRGWGCQTAIFFLPPSVTVRITWFDRGRSIAPFNFRVKHWKSD